MLLDIRSPAPLLVAPADLLGILLDEQALPELNGVRARERASIE